MLNYLLPNVLPEPPVIVWWRVVVSHSSNKINHTQKGDWHHETWIILWKWLPFPSHAWKVQCITWQTTSRCLHSLKISSFSFEKCIDIFWWSYSKNSLQRTMHHIIDCIETIQHFDQGYVIICFTMYTKWVTWIYLQLEDGFSIAISINKTWRPNHPLANFDVKLTWFFFRTLGSYPKSKTLGS